MDSRSGDAKPIAISTRCVRNDEHELRRLRSEVASQRRDIHDLDNLEHRQEELIARLREAAVREGDLAALRERLAAAEHQLEDLRGSGTR